MTFEPGKVRLGINEETHLADLLDLLWKQYGKNRVEQPDRWTVEIADEPDLPGRPRISPIWSSPTPPRGWSAT